jgi:hypothetical protein
MRLTGETMLDLEIDTNALIDDGYLVVPGFIPQERIQALRSACDANPTDYWTPGDVLANAELSDVIFSERSAEVVHRLLGVQAICFPNFTVRRNARTDWHIDNAFIDDLGGTAIAPRFLQCAVYLQDNNAVSGGGIDAVRGSHRRHVFDGRQYIQADVIRFPQRRLPSRAGDLVIWDARLLHRSTPLSATPLEKDKYGIHWTLARSVEFAEPFLDHIQRRAQSDYDKARGEDRRYAAICELRFPQDFPEELVRAIKRSGLQMVSRTEFC